MTIQNNTLGDARISFLRSGIRTLLSKTPPPIYLVFLNIYKQLNLWLPTNREVGLIVCVGGRVAAPDWCALEDTEGGPEILDILCELFPLRLH